ncbi:hypothetical protein [Algisphaera agarilytica]|uniref:DNA-directed RNA polymerase subunit RPC12/RpoP n=1 Tax=Algisphaera agarilytica TaxID=1385975 RepID=A0A7X0H969_9BACT|nr:hypothetical protein [Algisphaera agarilytica]MBB6431428.1 DNA-directed RNA polymerase subunit RPC12/RpoP [Algisphaera agarilytica]
MTDSDSHHDSPEESPATDTAEPTPASQAPVETPVAVNKNGDEPKPKKPKVVLCPYCGHAQQQSDRCSDCGGLFEPLSRRATQIAMGPWYIRNKNSPFRPGCSYEVLVKMIEAGGVGPMTVLRGPTTRQFWSVARNVPGIAHMLGYCHACGAHVDKDADLKNCPSCDAVFRSVKQRNELGLQFPNRRAAEAAQRSLNRLLGIAPAEADGEVPETTAEDAESMSEDQDQVVAAAAAAGDQAPESIFEQDAGTPAIAAADDQQRDLISDLLGDTVPTPPSAPAPPPDPAPLPDAPPQRAETPAPLTASTPDEPHPAALPPRREINWLVVLLVALNVLVAAAVIAFVATRSGEG